MAAGKPLHTAFQDAVVDGVVVARDGHTSTLVKVKAQRTAEPEHGQVEELQGTARRVAESASRRSFDPQETALATLEAGALDERWALHRYLMNQLTTSSTKNLIEAVVLVALVIELANLAEVITVVHRASQGWRAPLRYRVVRAQIL